MTLMPVVAGAAVTAGAKDVACVTYAGHCVTNTCARGSEKHAVQGDQAVRSPYSSSLLFPLVFLPAAFVA